jgi:outer membrane receptor for ferrienterochelin and colicin
MVCRSREARYRLKAEHITSHEVIFERSITSWLNGTVDGFYNQLTNLIDEEPDPATGLNHFVNSGRDQGEGVEFELSAVRGSGLAARASYTFADARDLVQQAPLANSPSHLGKLNGTLPLVGRGFLSTEVLFSSAQVGYGGNAIPSSILTNLTLSSRRFRNTWEFSASCYNLFNQSWSSPAGPGLIENDIPQDGRTYRIKLSYRVPVEHVRARQ